MKTAWGSPGRAAACIAVLALSLVSCGESADPVPAPGADPRETAADYVVRFLPRYFTFKMQSIFPRGLLVSPSEVTSTFKNIATPNVDTVYAAALFDLSAEPMVLTLPETDLRFGVQVMDLMTEVLPHAVGPPGGRQYGFVGPGWGGALPPGTERIDLPVNGVIVIVRANKNLGDRDVSAEARAWIDALALRRLSGLLDLRTLVVPEVILSRSTKAAIDGEASQRPLEFLAGLREAVRDPLTPLTASDRRLMAEFDRLFQEGAEGGPDPARQAVLDEMAAGAGDAFDRIRGCYRAANPTSAGWRFFAGTGRWGDRVLDRASVGEYYIYANVESEAQYYYVYEDQDGRPLTGEGGNAYEIRFQPGRLPRAGAFWSLTAYTNDTMTFIPNDARQYNVPGYRQGLATEPDGSVVVSLQQESPPSHRVPNWLPIREQPFHVLLRVFDPLVPYGGYEPPAVERVAAGD